MIDSFKKKLETMKINYAKKEQEKNNLIKKRKEVEKNIESVKKETFILEVQNELLSEASKEARKNAKIVIEDMTTNALNTALDEDVRFNILLDESKTPVSAEFEMETFADGKSFKNDPKDADGGGAGDIVSLATFTEMNYLYKDKDSAPLLLDEPTKYISSGFSLNMARFLYSVAKDLNKQIFLITHDKTLMQVADKAFIFTLDSKRRTQVTEQKNLL